MAKLHFTYSAMDAGKTTEIIQVDFKYNDVIERRKRYRERHGEEDPELPSIDLLVKPGVDTKGGDKVVSRQGSEKKVDIVVPPDAQIHELIGDFTVVKNVVCVLVDEAQFLTPHQADDLYWKVSSRNRGLDIPVMAYGLRTDAFGIPFDGAARLLALADELNEITTSCRCMKRARFQARLDNDEYIFEGDVVAIDGEGNTTYESLCKECFAEEYNRYFAKKTGAVAVTSP